MYLFKFLARSIGLTIPVMLRMVPVVGITFFLIGAVIYALSPYPVAIYFLAAVFGLPITMALAISAVRAGLSQMRETTSPDLGKLFRKTIQLSVFHFVIALFFSFLTWFVAAALVPDNWLENTSILLQDAEQEEQEQEVREPINLPTVSQRGARNQAEPFQPAGRLETVNPDGLERSETEAELDETQDEQPVVVEPEEPIIAEQEAPPEPEIEEELTSITFDGEAPSAPTLTGFFDHVFDEYSRLAIGFYSVQGLYWLVLSALAVPFAAQAATVA